MSYVVTAADEDRCPKTKALAFVSDFGLRHQSKQYDTRYAAPPKMLNNPSECAPRDALLSLRAIGSDG
jgi:hypothetical protein